MRVGQQSSAVVLELLPRMLALAFFRISEADSRDACLCGGSIILNLAPETAGLSPSVAGCKYRNWRLRLEVCIVGRSQCSGHEYWFVGETGAFLYSDGCQFATK